MLFRSLEVANKQRRVAISHTLCDDFDVLVARHEALAGKAVRLARIDVRAANPAASSEGSSAPPADDLAELSPLDVFAKAYQAKYTGPVPEELVQLFREIAAGIDQSE